VIEDHPIIQELLVTSLTLAGYHCSCVAAEAVASLAWIENSISTVPDGIILDIDIRASIFHDPAEFLHLCCGRWRTASSRMQMPPLLLLTTQPEAQNACEREGYTVLQKPFKPRHLLEQMETVIMQRQE